MMASKLAPFGFMLKNVSRTFEIEWISMYTYLVWVTINIIKHRASTHGNPY